VSGDSSSI